MIIYKGKKSEFEKDVIAGQIAIKIREVMESKHIQSSESEYKSWENSLVEMKDVMFDSLMEDDVQVAVEYQIPKTSKRIDFLVAGADENNEEHVVVIELKQWEEAKRTNKNGIISTYTGGMMRSVVHPSYQAYSYAKTIENFNAVVQDERIGLHACAYLHNYKKSKEDEIKNSFYEDIIKEAPIYIKDERKLLSNYICKYIKKSSERDLLYKIDNGKIKPSKSLQDSLASMLSGNEEFIMIDEQKVVYETIKKLIDVADKVTDKYTIIVEGGPGTGKSVVAIQLLVDLIVNKELNISYVTKNSTPRNVYFEKLKKGDFKNNYIKTLFKSSGSFVESCINEYDCLLVDESHRLNEKSNFFGYGDNQIKEIINASKISVFFIDENQIVTSKDIGSINEIKKWAEKCGSKIIYNDDTKLYSQFRCNGSNEYISFLNNVLGIADDNIKELNLEYDLRIFDSASDMREVLREKNEVNNKARILAGYCYEWKTKKTSDTSAFDIEIGKDFKARWNFSSTSTWAIDEDSFEQVGCIHTSQGLEFDYVGVIIGRDLFFDDEKVCTDKNVRAKTDKSLHGLKKDMTNKADTIIRNTYKTLLSRGQKGCYIYCEDKALQNHIKSKIEILMKNNIANKEEINKEIKSIMVKSREKIVYFPNKSNALYPQNADVKIGQIAENELYTIKKTISKNDIVRHKEFGVGEVLEVNEDSMIVVFGIEKKKLAYPGVIDMGLISKVTL